MFYRLLGFLVWRGGLWFLRHRYGRYLPPRKVVMAALVGGLVAGIVAAGARRERLTS